MNALCITDLHADSAGKFSHILPSGLPSRFASLLDVLAQVEKQIGEYQPTDLLIGGDLLNRRHFVSFRIYNPLYLAIERLTRMVKKTVLIPGNHDFEQDDQHGLLPYKNLPNLVLCDQPSILELSDGTPLCALPYMHDALAMADAFERAPSECVVLSHYAAAGVPLATEYFLESPIKLGELARFPRVIFGHIHKPSEQLDGKVVNVGSVQAFDFGDVGPRGPVLFHDGGFTRLSLSAPTFVTTTWPRLPSAPLGHSGFLRILGVPPAKVLEAKEAAQRIGWLDSDVRREAALPEMRTSIASGLVVDRAALEALVIRKAPELSEAQRATVVDAGEALLLEARK